MLHPGPASVAVSSAIMPALVTPSAPLSHEDRRLLQLWLDGLLREHPDAELFAMPRSVIVRVASDLAQSASALR